MDEEVPPVVELKVENDSICKTENNDQEVFKEEEIEETIQPDKIEYSDSSEDCYGEEEWLIEELELFVQETINIFDKDINLFPDIPVKKEIKQQSDESGVKEIEVTKENRSCIKFLDKTLPHEDMFICEVCERVFGTRYKLESHQYRTHNINKIPVKKSRKRKLTKNKDDWPPNVQQLAQRVNGKKMFFCNLCSYNVGRCDSIKKHMLRIHSNGRTIPQHQCEVCGKTFIDKAYLRNHGVSHVKQRSHTCEVCGRAFHRQPSLKRHRQTHSDDKQFSCSLCDYKTNRKHLMYKHIEHHKTGRAYTCRACGLAFYTQMSFRSHIYTHNITPNTCSFCKVGFSSKERMMCHMRKVHFTCEIKELKVE